MTTVTLKKEEFESLKSAIEPFAKIADEISHSLAICKIGEDVYRLQIRCEWLLNAKAVMSIKPVEERNQCDGCRRGMPLKDGTHYGNSEFDLMKCTADLYKSEEKKCEHDDGEVWERKFVGDAVNTKRNYPICPFCPKPEERKSPEEIAEELLSAIHRESFSWKTREGKYLEECRRRQQLLIAAAIKAERNQGSGE